MNSKLKNLSVKPLPRKRMPDEYVNENIEIICTEIYLEFLSSGCATNKLKLLINYLIDCKEIDVIKLNEKLLNVVNQADATMVCNTMFKFNHLTYQRTFDDIRFKIISELIKIYIKYADINKEEK